MRLGFPSAGLAGDAPGPMIVQDGYIAWQHGDENYIRNTLTIRMKDSALMEQGLPSHEQYGPEKSITFITILRLCGIYNTNEWSMNLFAQGPETVVIVLVNVRNGREQM
jgi:hypothetical protein